MFLSQNINITKKQIKALSLNFAITDGRADCAKWNKLYELATL